MAPHFSVNVGVADKYTNNMFKYMVAMSIKIGTCNFEQHNLLFGVSWSTRDILIHSPTNLLMSHVILKPCVKMVQCL